MATIRRSWWGSRPIAAVGAGAGRRRLPGLRSQPVERGPLPRAPQRVRRQERHRRLVCAGGHSAYRPAPAARTIAGDSAEAEAVKVLARAHKTLYGNAAVPNRADKA